MSSLVPNTPFFRSLTKVEYANKEDISFHGDVIGEDEKVDFNKKSRNRRHLVICNDTKFYVDLDEIYKISSIFAEQLQDKNGVKLLKNVDPSAFETLLRTTCPSNYGLYPESITASTIDCLLLLSCQLHLEKVIRMCRDFILNNSVKTMTISQLFNLFEIVHKHEKMDITIGGNEISSLAMRSCLIKALLEHSDQDDLIKHTLSSDFSASPIIKEAFKLLHNLKHKASFINAGTPIRCHCSTSQKSEQRLYERTARVMTLSDCGLICDNCSMACCSSCKENFCSDLINEFLLDYYERSTASSSTTRSISSSSTTRSTTPLQEECYIYEEEGKLLNEFASTANESFPFHSSVQPNPSSFYPQMTCSPPVLVVPQPSQVIQIVYPHYTVSYYY